MSITEMSPLSGLYQISMVPVASGDESGNEHWAAPHSGGSVQHEQREFRATSAAGWCLTPPTANSSRP